MRFSLQITPGLNGHDSSVSISTQIALIGLITSLSYLVFGAYRTQSYWSRQFSFIVSVDCTCKIGHVLVLFSFHHTPHPILLVTTIQFHFWHRSHLQDPSHHCLLWFLSQTAPSHMGHDISVLIQAQTALVRSFTSLSCLIFVINYSLSYLSRQFIFIFGIDDTFMIDHIIVLSCFCHRSHPFDGF